jgi:glyoxylase-like metal-dependent hydrolase (beta-lactamase superfamily II)
MITTPEELYASFRTTGRVRLLDVRNKDEFARWKIEGPGAIDTLNIPYFEFIEDDAGSIAKVESWLGASGGELAVVCAKGGSSEFVADLLVARGIRARNLAGGMQAWGSATATREIAASPVRVFQVQRFGKGCLSYILVAGTHAWIVDPHRRREAYERALHDRGLELRGVIDTHLHADHISGARSIAEDKRVPCYGHAADFEGARFDLEPIRDRARIRDGALEIEAITCVHSPGHTPGSIALRVNDKLLLSGDTLFIGSVGRPDLAGKAAEWGRDLHRTLHERWSGLSDELVVLPAHTSGPEELDSDGTISARLGDLRRKSADLRASEHAFVERVCAPSSPAPPQYATIREINLGARAVTDDEQCEMELGKNECALSRKH